MTEIYRIQAWDNVDGWVNSKYFSTAIEEAGLMAALLLETRLCWMNGTPGKVRIIKAALKSV